MTPKENFAKAITDLGLSMSTEFVPWSKSRHYKVAWQLTDRTLNWKVTLKRTNAMAAQIILTTDYSAGIGHCPSYKASERNTVDYVAAITFETEHGRKFTTITRGASIVPDICDVMYGLITDSDVMEYSSFEDWASNYGYDTDSRSAEKSYNACLSIALALRNAIGETGMQQLRDAAQGY